MLTTLSVRCRCGTLRGTASGISPASGTRLLCYCADCQAFARFLGRVDVLDAWGGTDIFHLSPSQIQFTEGADQLRCVRLSSKGLFRWYVACCRTPIGNMIGPRIPFIGLIVGVLGDAIGGPSRAAALGEPRWSIWGKFARAGAPPQVHPKVPPAMLASAIKLLLGWWVRAKGHPSEFFDATTRAPRSEPEVLSAGERAALDRSIPA
jgi:hypothetical protein